MFSNVNILVRTRAYRKNRRSQVIAKSVINFTFSVWVEKDEKSAWFPHARHARKGKHEAHHLYRRESENEKFPRCQHLILSAISDDRC